MPIFSKRTIAKFEDASAGIPLRPLTRAFEEARIALGEDPGGSPGSRRTDFRRYVASIDQNDPEQLGRLGEAFGAMVGEVATSKVEFLITAAQSDGFAFVDGAFRQADATAGPDEVRSVDELASIDAIGRRLHLRASDAPNDAVDGAKRLVDSTFLTVLRLLDETHPGDTTRTNEIASANERARSVLANLEQRRDSARDARLAVGVAVAFANFIAETHAAPIKP